MNDTLVRITSDAISKISRQSVADLVEKLIHDPDQLIGESVGISKLNTEGPAPQWYR